MNEISVVSVPQGTTGPNRKPAGGAGRRRAQRLAVALTPLIVTLVTAAPAVAWPETGW